MFQVGQRVVCVVFDFQDAAIRFSDMMPIKGTVYTIRSVKPYPDGPGVRLFEIVNSPKAYIPGSDPLECTFDARGFRPVDETRLDVFRKALEPAKVDRDLIHDADYLNDLAVDAEFIEVDFDTTALRKRWIDREIEYAQVWLSYSPPIYAGHGKKR